jgi:putative intracellular protease/amidase
MSPAFPHVPTVLLVLTSHATLGNTGRSTGYTVSEAADPWRVFVDRGWDVHVATVAGGPAPEDGFDPADPTQVAWKNDPAIVHQLATAPRPDHVNAAIYDVVYLVGGHGTMWDFPDNHTLSELLDQTWERGAVVAAVCHGPAALTTATTADGRRLIDGRRVTGFSNAEEAAVELTDVVPFLLADRLAAAGGMYSEGPVWEPHVVVDGRLVTGQNPASAAGVAVAAIAASGR